MGNSRFKFRAWSEPTKEMEYNITSIDFKGETIYFDKGVTSPNKEQETDYWHKPFILMQYTGLKDKNSVEIYEGDIVKCSRGCPHEIIWLEEYGGRYTGGMPAWYLSSLNEGYAWTGDEEVIGNIHENPELLEVEE